MPIAGSSLISLGPMVSNGWSEYGQKLVQLVPEQLGTDLLAFIPDELETELEHPLNAHAKTYEQIIEWCKSRRTKSRQTVLAA